MAGTAAQINWTAVQFLTQSIKRVTNAMFSLGGSLITFKGDTDLYPSVIAAVTLEPRASITTGDPATMMGFAAGADGTLTATMKDAKGVAGGDVVFTMTHAVFENADTTGAHAQFGTVTGTFRSYAPDGQTPPLAFSRA
jgi:hypothetical protein